MEIRQATAEDWEVLKHLWALCFRDGEPSEATWEEVVDHAEVFVAVEAGRVVGSYQSILFDMHYGEPTLPMGGLAGVATAPTHRGRGIAQGLMRHAVLRMRDTQRPLSMLYAFSLRFYRALGWELIGKSYEFRQLLREVPTAPEAERTREVEAAPGPDFEQVHSRWARQYRGPCDRYPKRWRAQFRRPANKLGYAYVYDGDEGPAGYLHFVPGDDDCEPHEFLSIREFAALTPEAHRGLMGMLRRLGTQYEHAGWHGPADSWVFTEPYDHGLKVRLTDQPMMRATDPGRLLAVRAPQPVSGAYTLRVHEFDWAGGPQTFQVTLDDGRPDVRASVQGPGIEMDPCAFIRCWMGEPDAAALRRAGHVAVHDEEQFSAFCGHFPRAIVWTPEEF
jgi:predicted acetyltransferase